MSEPTPRRGVYVALDAALTSGWAVNDPDAPGGVASGTHTVAAPRGVAPAMRFVLFGAFLADLLRRYQPEALIYERSLYRGGAATEVAVGLTTRAQSEATLLGVPYQSVDNQKLKRWATGTGAADKDLMRDHAARHFPHYCAKLAGAAARGERYDPGGDEADALHLLRWAMAGFPSMDPPKTPRPRRPAAPRPTRPTTKTRPARSRATQRGQPK